MSQLWKHQEEAVERAAHLGHFGFFFDTGTGKTRTCIETMRVLYTHNDRLLRTLIVSPIITLENWRREILKFSKIPDTSIVVLVGSGKQRRRLFSERGENKDCIVIVNYEALLDDELHNMLMFWTPKVVVADEVHYIKTPTSKRTKRVHAFVKNSWYRFGLTGTAVLNSAMDLWSQMYFIDGGKAFGDKFHFFKTKYFYDKNSGMPSHKHFPNWVPRPTAYEEIKQKISTSTMSVKKSDCLDLPPLVRKTVYVELGSKQKKLYEEMKRDFITYVNDSACVATLAITKALRMQQFLAGFVVTDEKEELVIEDNPRMDALEELLESMAPDHKIIVWSPFKITHSQIEKVCEKLEIKYVRLTGDESSQEKFANMDAFENDPSVRVCIGNQSVGIGVNLVASDVSIYYGRTFNLGHDEQSEARNYRSGSERHQKITRIDIVAPDTIDEKIMEALRNKKDISASLLQSIAKELMLADK